MRINVLLLVTSKGTQVITLLYKVPDQVDSVEYNNSVIHDGID